MLRLLENWIRYVELEKRERTTVVQYRNHVDNHINPRLGGERLAKLTTPRIQAFRDELLAALSRAQAKKVLTSLKSLLKDAQRRGHVAQNVAVSVSIKRDIATARLKVGFDIRPPTRSSALSSGSRSNPPSDCGDIHRPAFQ